MSTSNTLNLVAALGGALLLAVALLGSAHGPDDKPLLTSRALPIHPRSAVVSEAGGGASRGAGGGGRSARRFDGDDETNYCADRCLVQADRCFDACGTLPRCLDTCRRTQAGCLNVCDAPPAPPRSARKPQQLERPDLEALRLTPDALHAAQALATRGNPSACARSNRATARCGAP